MGSVEIKTGSIGEVVQLSNKIPEFHNPHDRAAYEKRILGKNHLILIAFVNTLPVGFKLGYQKFNDGSFYSWMGGVLPDYRKMGIAKSLADFQENWVIEQGYQTLKMKTRNRHTSMLLFAIGNGFKITQLDKREDIEENRIHLEKQLNFSK